MLIERGMKKKARYLLKEGERYGDGGSDGVRNFGFSRPDGSLGSGGVLSTWGTIQLLSREGLASLLNHTLDLVEYGYQRVKESEVLRPVHVPEINTMLIGLRERARLSEREVNLIQERLYNNHGYYISCNGEVDDGRPAFRFVPTHPFTTTDDVERMISALEKEIIDYLRR